MAKRLSTGKPISELTDEEKKELGQQMMPMMGEPLALLGPRPCQASLEELITTGHRAEEAVRAECRAIAARHPYMEIQVNHSFEAAHRLPGHTGKCERLHGHSYRVRVMLKGLVREDGMVIDFGHVKDVLDQLDHRYLNDFMENPTAEHTAQWLLERIPLATAVHVWEGLGGGSVVARI